jgi:uncharacterized protein (TIGR02452 family)
MSPFPVLGKPDQPFELPSIIDKPILHPTDSNSQSNILPQEDYFKIISKDRKQIKDSKANAVLHHLTYSGQLDFHTKSKSLQTQLDYSKNSTKRYHATHSFTITKSKKRKGQIYVSSENTCLAAHRLIVIEGKKNVGLLNFGSKSPGGDFLEGETSQQSVICRQSGLYPIIKNQKKFYQENKKLVGFHSDALLFSPDVPFVFDENLQPLPEYFNCSVITALPVNLKYLKKQKEKEFSQKPKTVMFNRIQKIIQCAIVHGIRVLILGNFGCGGWFRE